MGVMGCVPCAQVLYLCLYLLHWQQYQTWVPLQLPKLAQQAAKGKLLSGCGEAWRQGPSLQGLCWTRCVRGLACHLLYFPGFFKGDHTQCADSGITLAGPVYYWHANCPSSVLAGYLPAGGIPLVGLLAAFCVPGTLIKQFINLVQMKAAMALLVALDRKRDQQAKSE